jgi:hypothetical protein
MESSGGRRALTVAYLAVGILNVAKLQLSR